jgi:Ca2+-binding EF-hand superfamily protein
MEIFWTRIECRFKNLQKAFRFFDSSRDNEVVYEEFKDACYRAGLKFTVSELEQLFNKFDSRKGGFITYADFVRLNGDKRSKFVNTYTTGKKCFKFNDTSPYA